MWIVELFLGLVQVFVGGRSTRRRGSLEEMRRRHPGSRVHRAELIEGPSSSGDLFENVAFVLATSRGLEFRDADGHRELEIPISRIARVVDVAPIGRGEHVRVEGPDGRPLVEFWAPDAGTRVHVTNRLRLTA